MKLLIKESQYNRIKPLLMENKFHTTLSNVKVGSEIILTNDNEDSMTFEIVAIDNEYVFMKTDKGVYKNTIFFVTKTSLKQNNIILKKVKIPKELLDGGEIETSNVDTSDKVEKPNTEKSKKSVSKPKGNDKGKEKIMYSSNPDGVDTIKVKNLADTHVAKMFIFEIKIKSDNQNASFKVVEYTDSQEYAIEKYKTVLIDACEFLNEPNNSTKIITETPGKMVKEGDKWRITQKAKIKFA